MFDPELNLLTATCRSAYGGGSDDVEPSSRTADWRRFLHLARRHRVQALSWHGLGPSQARVPPEIAEQFRADSVAIVETTLRASA